MKSSIINISMSENIVDFVCEYAAERKDKKVAFISGGKRQFLFIKKKLAQIFAKAFISPHFFTSDEFIENIFFEMSDAVKIPDMEAAYLIYKAVEKEAPALLRGKNNFPNFMNWAFEIFSFIEQLDLENVGDDKLKNIKANADIGYDVPENINNLLKNIFEIRKYFHRSLENVSSVTKGYSFLKVSKEDFLKNGFDYDEIVLIAPFYMHETELKIFKRFFDADMLTVIVQGDPHQYDSLKKLYEYFGCPAAHKKKQEKPAGEIAVYAAFDNQSQAVLLKNLLKEIPPEKYSQTLIAVPDANLIRAIVAEISSLTDDYNVSAGYEASKTAVFNLLKAISDAQLSRKGKNYYVKDFLKVLSNPLVKNMRFSVDSSVTRIIVHKIEEFLDKNSLSVLSGKIFISFGDILAETDLLNEISRTSSGTSGYVNETKLKKILEEIFNTLFVEWEKLTTLSSFAKRLRSFTETLYKNSVVSSYPLNSQAIDILLSLSEQLLYGNLSTVEFLQEDVFNIFNGVAEKQKIALSGSPLNGLQILGLLESRNLSFENVFVTGMSDSAVPAIRKESPLIPKDIMFALGMPMAKKEYEIQQYHFDRLLYCAKKIHLIYPDNEKESRSRFIERLIWNKQYEEKNLSSMKVKYFLPPRFSAFAEEKKKYFKNDKIKKYLSDMKYSYSKIDTYLRCELQFYFKYVLGLDSKNEAGSEISEGDMGTFIHKFLRNVFYDGMKKENVGEESFKKVFFEKLEAMFNGSAELKGREDSFLIKRVLEYRLSKIPKIETERDYKTIYCREKKYESKINTKAGTFNIECIIDRVDEVFGGYAVIDYKTGTVREPLMSKKFDEIIASGFNRKNIKKAVKSLQLPLYKYIFEKFEKEKVCDCLIYGIKKGGIYDFFDGIADREYAFETCIEIIKYILTEIVNKPYFEFDKDESENCANCKYFYICANKQQ